MSCDFGLSTWHRFLKKEDNCTEYLVLVEQNQVTGYRNNLVVSWGAQKNLASDVDPHMVMTSTEI